MIHLHFSLFFKEIHKWKETRPSFPNIQSGGSIKTPNIHKSALLIQRLTHISSSSKKKAEPQFHIHSKWWSNPQICTNSVVEPKLFVFQQQQQQQQQHTHTHTHKQEEIKPNFPNTQSGGWIEDTKTNPQIRTTYSMISHISSSSKKQESGPPIPQHSKWRFNPLQIRTISMVEPEFLLASTTHTQASKQEEIKPISQTFKVAVQLKIPKANPQLIQSIFPHFSLF